MFEDSLFASRVQARQQRGWFAFVSFAVQALFVGILVAMPMLFTDALPFRPISEIVEVPPAPRAAQSNAPAVHRKDSQANVHQILRVPSSIPREVIQIIDPPSLPQVSNDSGGPGAIGPGNGDQGDPQLSLLTNAHPIVTPTIQRPVKRPRISGGVEQGLLIQDVKPVYPRWAREAGVQGEVILQAVIDKNGRIENLRVISGNPLLVKAALDAVKQWRYRPYLLNGEPVEVETQITVNFNMS